MTNNRDVTERDTSVLLKMLAHLYDQYEELYSRYRGRDEDVLLWRMFAGDSWARYFAAFSSTFSKAADLYGVPPSQFATRKRRE